MQITQLLESNTLLTYALTTAPVPVQVSPSSGPPSIATLTFAISAPMTNGGGVVVKEITFNLPVGNPAQPDSSDLTLTSEGINPSASSSSGERWDIVPGTATGSFVLSPPAGASGEIDAQGLSVVFTGIKVSQIVGTAQLRVLETAGTGGRPSERRVAVVALAKFPYNFSAGNFSAETPLVPNGGSAILSWSGSQQAIYTILWSTHSQVVSNQRRWTSPPLSDVTSFILQVTVQQGGQTVELRFGATVVVANPSIVAKELTVDGASILKRVAVKGTLDVQDRLAAKGPVSFFAESKRIQTGFRANTDGFVIGKIFYDYPGPMKKCWGLIRGESSLGNAEATGGNCVIWGNGLISNVASSFLLPVQAGTNFRLLKFFHPESQVEPTIEITWVPLGRDGVSAPMLKKVQAPAPGKMKSFSVPSTLAVPDRTREVDTLVSALERALKIEIPRTGRGQLKKAFLDALEGKSAAKKPKPAAKRKRSAARRS